MSATSENCASAVTIPDLIAAIERNAGNPLGRDEGHLFGSADRPVRTAVVAWMATPDAIEHAGAVGAQLLLVHESLYYPYDTIPAAGSPEADWPVNRQRRLALEHHGLSVLRIHGTADRLSIYDAFCRQLGLGRPLEERGAYAKVYPAGPGETVADWVHRVKERTGRPALRVSAPRGLDAPVTRIGLTWGGLGLFLNVSYQASILALGADLLIGGESDSYGFRFAAEVGVAHIESGHSVSENAGLLDFTALLAGLCPGIRFVFHECAPSWRII